MDVFLQAEQPKHLESVNYGSGAGTGKIDHIVASGQVAILQPGRRATGDLLVYTTFR